MRIPSTLQDEPLNAAAQAKEACEEIRAIEEQREQANNDAVFELACRVIVMKSLPAWIDEICAEHLGRSTDSLRKMAVAPWTLSCGRTAQVRHPPVDRGLLPIFGSA
jgi:hypothetical protein